MSNTLFSQIPPQILGKLGGRLRAPRDERPNKRPKFYEDDEETKSSISEIDVIEVDRPEVKKQPSINEQQPTSSNQECKDDDEEETEEEVKQDSRKEQQPKHRDAIIQTDKKVLVSVAVQTDENMMNRPLHMTEDDMHRLNMQSFAPVRPLPRARGASEPPLKIGLTLRGRKRRVLYPDDDDYVPPEICSARGA